MQDVILGVGANEMNCVLLDTVCASYVKTPDGTGKAPNTMEEGSKWDAGRDSLLMEQWWLESPSGLHHKESPSIPIPGLSRYEGLHIPGSTACIFRLHKPGHQEGTQVLVYLPQSRQPESSFCFPLSILSSSKDAPTF